MMIKNSRILSARFYVVILNMSCEIGSSTEHPPICGVNKCGKPEKKTGMPPSEEKFA